MLKRIQRGFDHIKSSKTTARCQVKIEIQKLEDLPQTIKQVRVVWAKSVGKGIKASTDSCVVHSGNRLKAISKLLRSIAYPCRNSLCPFTTACDICRESEHWPDYAPRVQASQGLQITRRIYGKGQASLPGHSS